MRPILSLLAACLVACTARPTGIGLAPSASCSASAAPVTPPASDAVSQACANLAAAGCSEGGASCVATMNKAIAASLTTMPLACLQSIKDKAGARACGPQIECP